MRLGLGRHVLGLIVYNRAFEQLQERILLRFMLSHLSRTEVFAGMQYTW